jgi:hypothetical protein
MAAIKSHSLSGIRKNARYSSSLVPNIRPQAFLHKTRRTHLQTAGNGAQASEAFHVPWVVGDKRVAIEDGEEVVQSREGRCTKFRSSYKLEYDHMIPYSMGGESTVDNLRILTYLLYLYGKEEAEVLSPDEKKALKILVNSIKGERQ